MYFNVDHTEICSIDKTIWRTSPPLLFIAPLSTIWTLGTGYFDSYFLMQAIGEFWFMDWHDWGTERYRL